MKKMPKGASPTQYIGGIVANQSSNMAATMVGSNVNPDLDLHCLPRPISPLRQVRNLLKVGICIIEE